MQLTFAIFQYGAFMKRRLNSLKKTYFVKVLIANENSGPSQNQLFFSCLVASTDRMQNILLWNMIFKTKIIGDTHYNRTERDCFVLQLTWEMTQKKKSFPMRH